MVEISNEEVLSSTSAQIEVSVKLENNADITHSSNHDSNFQTNMHQATNYQPYYAQYQQANPANQYYQYNPCSTYNSDYYYGYNSANMTNNYYNNQFLNNQSYQPNNYSNNSTYSSYNYAAYDNLATRSQLQSCNNVKLQAAITANETVNDSSSLLSVSTSSSSTSSSEQSPKSPIKNKTKDNKSKKAKKAKNQSNTKSNESETNVLIGPADLSVVNIDLSNMCLWEKFHQHTTEMIITKQGR